MLGFRSKEVRLLRIFRFSRFKGFKIFNRTFYELRSSFLYFLHSLKIFAYFIAYDILIIYLTAKYIQIIQALIYLLRTILFCLVQYHFIQQIYLLKHIMALVSPKRPNFSRYGKLCDQTFYHDQSDKELPIYSDEKIEYSSSRSHQKLNSTTWEFKSISRQKRGNFRTSIPDMNGQYSHHPNHLIGRKTNPSWSFSKAEKYQNQKATDYQICPKNYMLTTKHSNRQFTQSIRFTLRDKVKLNKSSSFISTTDRQKTFGMNYSIVDARKTSAVGFFNKTKIAEPLYMTKQGIMKAEQAIQKDLEKLKLPCPKGYIEFYKKRPRHPNRNVKKFETFLNHYSHEKQFNNYNQTKYPIRPHHHIDFEKHLDRPSYEPNKNGPNPEAPSIDLTRINKSAMNLDFSKFRTKIKTKYDRVGAQPNTIIDYYAKQPELPGMVEIDRTLPRKKNLFPIVDPIIKKSGDQEIKKTLKQFIKIKQINQALRPKCNEPCLPA